MTSALQLRTAALAVGLLLIAGCAEDGAGDGATDAAAQTSTSPASTSSAPAPPTTTSPVVGRPLAGSLVVSGTSFLDELSYAVARELVADEPAVEVDVGGPGVRDGVVRLCAGEIDVAATTRAMSADEVAACAAGGVEVVDLAVGWGAIAVVAAPGAPVDCLDPIQLYALVGVESEGFDDWADAGALAAAAGSPGPIPSSPLVVLAPGAGPGLFVIESIVLDPIASARGVPPERGRIRSDIVATPSDVTTLEGVAATPGALGIVQLDGTAVTGVELVAIRPGPDGACVEPTADEVAAGRYPLVQPYSLLVRVPHGDDPDDAALVAYVDRYLATVAAIASTHGVVPASADDLAGATSRWRAATGRA